MNAGKFPTASDARKEVGGSYYTIRQILQELEYNSKMSPIDIREATSKVNDTMKKNTSEEGMETSFSALEYLNDEIGSISSLVSSIIHVISLSLQVNQIHILFARIVTLSNTDSTAICCSNIILVGSSPSFLCNILVILKYFIILVLLCLFCNSEQ